MTEEREEHSTPDEAPEGDEELLTLAQAVEFLGTSKPTMYRWLERGDLRGLKVGKQWRFRKTDLRAYLERSPVAVAAAPAAELEREIAHFDEELRRGGASVPGTGSERAGRVEEKTELLARQIITLAVHSKASDIHFEPFRQGAEAYLLLRNRIDGLLHEVRRMPLSLHEALALQFREMANLDLTERRVPQEGRIFFPYGGKEFDLRLSCIPSLFGEAQVMRILDKTASSVIGLEKLGLSERDLEQIRRFVRQPNGLLLAAGPVGSGRSTLLYSCLQEIADAGRKTFAVEERAEHLLTYVTYFPVNPRAGVTLPAALRAVMRQDLDVVLIEEIRDLETARIALMMALTGHLVLAPILANNATDAVKRFFDLDVDPAVLGGTLLGVVGTRLVRTICTGCKEPYQPDPGDPFLLHMERLAAAGGFEAPDEVTLYRGRGCDKCRNRGLRGRTGLYEVLASSQPLLRAVLQKAPPEELVRLAVSEGMRTLTAKGMQKALEGLTTIDEVRRVTHTWL